MEYSLKRNQKIMFAASAAVFAIWMIVTVILSQVMEDIGTKYLWAIGMDIFWSVFLVLLIIKPTPKIFSKNINDDIKEQMVNLRRDLFCSILLTINVCCFGMALCHMFGITDFPTKEQLEAGEFLINKVGIINLVGMCMMLAIALLAVRYASKSKMLIYNDCVRKQKESEENDKEN